MRFASRRWVALLAPGLALAVWTLLLAMLWWFGLSDPQRDAIAQAPEPLIAVTVLAWLLTAVALARVAATLFQHHVALPARLEERTRIRILDQTREDLVGEGSVELRQLADAINQLARQRNQLLDDSGQQVRAASRDIDRERRRLAALMAELQQSVVVCNLDGRILLYNQRARLQYQSLAVQAALGEGSTAIGLGRSIYTVFDPQLVAHALDSIAQQLAGGAGNASAQFVTTSPSNQLLRVQVAAVLDEPDAEVESFDGPPQERPHPLGGPGEARAGAADPPTSQAMRLSGFVLLLEDLTRDFEQQSLREQLLHDMIEGSRSSLANQQAALEMLELADNDAPMRERFMAVVREESRVMRERVSDLASKAASGLNTRWPMQDMRGSDLVAAALRRIGDGGELQASAGPLDQSLWLRIDSFSLLQALAGLAGRLHLELGQQRVELRLAASGRHAHLDLVWHDSVMNTETAMSWELDPIRIGGQTMQLTVHEVVERHGGAFWFGRDRTRHEAWFRFLLPLADSRQGTVPTRAALAPEDSRPTFYDFDLFQSSDMARALHDRRLDELSYTVFDTETTGLDPSRGDEIIQIGATRIVNGKLLHQEGFEQLVDPKRPVPAASTRIHGITPDMLQGQPDIGAVLLAFHAYAHDTVLVAHNAAFDMRFLQLKEATSGVVFDQPVLDTLLLSDLVHPLQPSHALEALAQRLGVQIAGRHTALGDAIVTAQVFQKLVPLLMDKGIVTLGQARQAAQKSRFARVQY